MKEFRNFEIMTNEHTTNNLIHIDLPLSSTNFGSIVQLLEKKFRRDIISCANAGQTTNGPYRIHWIAIDADAISKNSNKIKSYENPK